MGKEREFPRGGGQPRKSSAHVTTGLGRTAGTSSLVRLWTRRTLVGSLAFHSLGNCLQTKLPPLSVCATHLTSQHGAWREMRLNNASTRVHVTHTHNLVHRQARASAVRQTPCKYPQRAAGGALQMDRGCWWPSTWIRVGVNSIKRVLRLVSILVRKDRTPQMCLRLESSIGFDVNNRLGE